MKNEKPNAPALLSKEAIAFADKRVKDDPRGAPITLPPDEDVTPLMEDAVNAPDPAPIAAPATTEGPRCVLEHCPPNSVLTVLQWPGEPPQVVVQTPNGAAPVPRDDIAWTLPVLAEVRKKMEGVYEGRQLDDPYDHPVLVLSSAVGVVKQFKRHFHGERE